MWSKTGLGGMRGDPMWWVCLLMLAFAPVHCMDNQCTGLGFFELQGDYYTDQNERPTYVKGISHELKSLISGAEDYHRRTLAVQGQQDAEDQRLEARAKRLPEQLIPRKIWQRCPSIPPCKVEKSYARTWRDRNLEYTYSLVGDDEAMEFVEEAYPALTKVYASLRDPQARVDFFAYLVLFKYGGVFASIDCTCEQPIQDLILPTDDLLTGLQPKLESRVLAKQVGLQHHTMPLQQFCIASAPGHPIMRFLIDYITKNANKRLCEDNAMVDTLLRTGAGPFTDAVLAFRKHPVDGRQVRVALLGAFALGQVWGAGDVVTVPCAKQRHNYGFWFDEERKKHMCDCPTKKEKSKAQRRETESVCFVRRRYIEGAGVKALVRMPELVRRRAARKWHT